MSILRRLPLALDVLLDGRLAAIPPDGVDEVPIGPELCTPEFLFELGFPEEHLSGGDALHETDNLCGWVHRDGLDEEVHMILIGPDLEEVEFVPLLKLKAHVFELLIDRLVEDHASVLRNADEVVEQDGDVVALVEIDAHPSSVPLGRSKLRGMDPKRDSKLPGTCCSRMPVTLTSLPNSELKVSGSSLLVP